MFQAKKYCIRALNWRHQRHCKGAGWGRSARVRHFECVYLLVCARLDAGGVRSCLCQFVTIPRTARAGGTA